MAKKGNSKEKPRVDDYPVTTVCPYCGGAVKFLSNSFIYGKEYGNGLCYACVDCRANVGVHTGTEVPLGRLADKATVKLRRECHSLFDPLWKDKIKFERRKDAYAWLASKLSIERRECHIAWLSDEQLRTAIEILKEG